MTILWVTKAQVLQFHDLQLARFGGSPGLRDEGLLESALARPKNLAIYGAPAFHNLAASYAYGIARNHPFVDGNKRTSFLTAAIFLQCNGIQIVAEQEEVAEAFLKLAAGEMSEAELAEWFHSQTAKIET